jgi:hypothetical protein
MSMNIIYLFLTLGFINYANSWCLRTSLSIGNEVREVDWSQDDSTFISIHKTENTLRIYDAKSYELLKIYQYIVSGIAQEPMSAKISKDSKWIGVGFANGDAVILYNIDPFNVYFTRTTGQAKVM